MTYGRDRLGILPSALIPNLIGAASELLPENKSQWEKLREQQTALAQQRLSVQEAKFPIIPAVIIGGVVILSLITILLVTGKKKAASTIA